MPPKKKPQPAPAEVFVVVCADGETHCLTDLSRLDSETVAARFDRGDETCGPHRVVRYVRAEGE